MSVTNLTLTKIIRFCRNFSANHSQTHKLDFMTVRDSQLCIQYCGHVGYHHQRHGTNQSTGSFHMEDPDPYMDFRTTALEFDKVFAYYVTQDYNISICKVVLIDPNNSQLLYYPQPSVESVIRRGEFTYCS